MVRLSCQHKETAISISRRKYRHSEDVDTRWKYFTWKRRNLFPLTSHLDRSLHHCVPLCLRMKSMILCSPSPGTLASDRKTWIKVKGSVTRKHTGNKRAFFSVSSVWTGKTRRSRCTRRLSYRNIPPSRIVVESVSNVVAKTFGQVVHELCSLKRWISPLWMCSDW